jgi:uncharacterized protein (DUF433 family)
MATDLIHDRGVGPELTDSRVTVYDLLLDFLDPDKTEEWIGRQYELTAKQVAAARAYILNNPDEVLSGHLQIEARMFKGNPPEVIERARQTRDTFLNFKKWLGESEREASQQQTAELTTGTTETGSKDIPTFKEWLARRETRLPESS